MAFGKGKRKDKRKPPSPKKESCASAKQEDVDSLPVTNPNAAGIDLGSEQHYVAVPRGRDEQSVKCFDCYTDDLHRMGKWLVACGIETVAMEATGVYWIPVIEVLEGHYHLDVFLVHPRYTKNVPGRKTDVLDCQWIQTLHSHGLLPASFRPSDEICRLRKYWRHRDRLVKDASKQTLRMQKELDEMNLHLHKVISDVTGMTGMKIIRAILAGERNPVTLAKMRDPRIKSSEEDIARALTGNYRQEHLDTLADVVETYDHLQSQLLRIDERIERELAQYETKVSPAQKPLSKTKYSPKKKGPNEPHFDLRAELYRLIGVDLTVVPGLAPTTLMGLMAECGIDMSPWPTEKHFTSWLSLAPGSKITGGKSLSGRTRRNPNRAAAALRLAAFGLYRSASALGAFFRRMKARHGPAKAITATARKLAVVYYRAMKTGSVYEDPGEIAYQQKYHEKTVQFLKKKAKEVGGQFVDYDKMTEQELEELFVGVSRAREAREALKNHVPQGESASHKTPCAPVTCGEVS